MAKEFAKDFYGSARWKKARMAAMNSTGGLCKMCLDDGVVEPAIIVHHLKPLTPDNIYTPLSTSLENLVPLCRQCHSDIHEFGERRRTMFTVDGDVVAR